MVHSELTDCLEEEGRQMFQFPHIIFKTSVVVPKGQEKKKRRKVWLERLLGSEVNAPCNSDDLGSYSSDTGKNAVEGRKRDIILWSGMTIQARERKAGRRNHSRFQESSKTRKMLIYLSFKATLC